MIVFFYVRFVKIFGCHYNQSGLLKIEILILLRLARFQNLGTQPTYVQDTLKTITSSMTLRPEGGGGGGGGGKSFKKPKKLLFPKSIHFLTTEILLPLIYL